MMTRLALAAGVAACAFSFTLQSAAAAPVAPFSSAISEAAADNSLVRSAQSCGAWNRICANRWGWGTWRYRRCMRDHFC
jgi:hypothetical protein